MIPPLFEQQQYQGLDAKKTPLEVGEYEQCEFIDCDLSESNLSYIKFIDCTFTRCNLSLTKTAETGMQHVEFIDCKLQGIQWSHCSSFLFEVAFTRCILNFCSFIQKKMHKTTFTECRLEEVDFTETDVSESVFKQCDLMKTIFQHTDLTGVDFTTSYNYVLNPEENTIKGAQFSLEGVGGLLLKYGIIIR